MWDRIEHEENHIPEKFENTETRMKILKNLGYKILYIWECEFLQWINSNSSSKLFDRLRCFEDRLEYDI